MVAITNIETGEQAGEITPGGGLTTDDDQLRSRVEQYRSEGIEVMVPHPSPEENPSVIVDGYRTITPDDTGFVQAVCEELSSPYIADYGAVNALPSYSATDNPTAETADTDLAASFAEGGVVGYGDGNLGVITAKLTENFTWPNAAGGDEREIEASGDEPVYIVARETGGAKPFTADELSTASFDGETPDSDELAEADLAAVYEECAVSGLDDAAAFDVALTDMLNIPGVDDPEVGFASLPAGWDRTSVLKAWASLGASFTSARARFRSHGMSDRMATRLAATIKDEALGTELWRGGF
jgi:hypothetical protein